MPWIYTQISGALHHNNVLVYDKGYSGKASAKNSPDREHESHQGPVPLTPSGHNAHGRKHFRIHGDDINDLGNASEGCYALVQLTRNDKASTELPTMEKQHAGHH